MKHVRIIAVALLVLLMAGQACYACQQVDKFGRGLCNLLGGNLMEVPKNIDLEWKASNNAAVGTFCGFFKGAVMAMGRTVSAVWDIATFAFPVPKGYEPLMKPAYVFGSDKE